MKLVSYPVTTCSFPGNLFPVCLSRQKKCVLEEGIEKAKRMLTCVFKQVQAALDMHQVIPAGPFVYLILQEVWSSM
jgi:hypothetical protein